MKFACGLQSAPLRFSSSIGLVINISNAKLPQHTPVVMPLILVSFFKMVTEQY